MSLKDRPLKQRNPYKQGLLIVEKPAFTTTDVQQAVTQAVNRALNREALKQEVLTAFHEVNYVIQRIDLIALGFNRTQLAQHLEGQDEELAMTYVRLKRLASKLGYDIDQLYPDSAKRIHDRIEAIQRVYKDGGESLRQIIAGMPGNMGTLAEFARDKVTQGRHISQETEFLYHQALYYKFELRSTWKRAAEMLLHDLADKAKCLNRGESVQDYNATAHNDLKTNSNPAQYLQNAYKNYKRAKSKGL
jgi:hypothetical protein